MISISAVIIAFNEERNIARCLESLENLVDEVLVVDSYSTDRTEEICRKYKVRFIQHKFESHIQQKNWALNQATNDYILSLDADEALSTGLRQSIIKAAADLQYDGYYMNRKTSYTNSRDPRDVRHVERKLRLWNRKKGAWGGINPHDTVIMDVDSKISSLKGDMLHYSFFSIESHRQKADYFSSISANALFVSGIRSNWFKIVFSPLWKFIKSYFIRRDFLDGLHGFRISYSSAYGTYLKYRKLKKLNSGKHLDIPASVCFFNTNKQWGGGEKWSLTVASELSLRGYKVIMIAYTGSELLRRSRQEGLNAVGLRMRTLSFIDPLQKLRIKRIYKANNVRTLFLNLSIDLKTGGKIARKAGVRKIIYRRGLAIPIRGNRRNRHLLSKVVTDIIATSEDTRKGILQNMSGLLDPGKIKLIYNGVDLPVMNEISDNGKMMVVGSAGRISSEKGFISLIDLARLLEQRGVPYEISLAGDGAQLDHIKTEVSKSGLDSKFRFHGFLKNMDDFYRSISLLVLTSEKEGFANVLLESMSYGKPVIAFDIGSPSELISDGNNGFIVEENNLEAMADRILELYNNPGLLVKLGISARDRIRENFSLQSHLDRVEEVIVK